MDLRRFCTFPYVMPSWIWHRGGLTRVRRCDEWSQVWLAGQILFGYNQLSTWVTVMILSEASRFLFLATPKTASTSLHEAFERTLGEAHVMGPPQTYHTSASTARKKIGAQWPDFFKVGFCRNPYSRLFSAFSDFSRRRSMDKYIVEDSWPEFCQIFLSSRWLNDIHFRPQKEFLCDREGELLVDYLGRYETLESDYRAICGELMLAPSRLEHRRRRNPSKDEWISHFTPEQGEMVRSTYLSDFTIFGYEPELP